MNNAVFLAILQALLAHEAELRALFGSDFTPAMWQAVKDETAKGSALADAEAAAVQGAPV